MQIIVPMSGFGERFKRAGYTVPKPLIEVEGKAIIGHVVDMFPGERDFLFICNRDHLADPSIDMEAAIRAYCPTARIAAIAPHKLGPVHALLEARDWVDPRARTVVNYCDFTCRWDWNEFKQFVSSTQCDGAIPAYRGFHPHSLGTTNYAYLREEGGWVSDIQEKQPFTADRMQEYASSGTYYFATGRLMLEACQATVDRRLETGGEYYVSLAYKHLLSERCRVAVFELPHFMQWGTPDDLAEYRMWSDTFRRLIDPRYADVPTMDGTTLVPMAGLGERFTREGYAVPKPLIPVSGVPMVLQATGAVPRTAAPIFVLRRDQAEHTAIARELIAAYPGARLFFLDGPTDGQARSALLGWYGAATPSDEGLPLTIAACDHGSLYRPEPLRRLLTDEGTDMIVWVARGYPNAMRRPEMYGWVMCDGDRVRGVSVKAPLGDPASDPIITGTFTFRRAEDFARVAERMIARNARVNGEFYVDTTIEDALALGLVCRVCEVDSYLCWGTPNDLRTFEYWQSCFDQWPSHPYRLEADTRVSRDAIAGLRDVCRAANAAQRSDLQRACWDEKPERYGE